MNESAAATAALAPGLAPDALLALLAPFGGERDPLAIAGTLVVRLPREQLRAALLRLRDGADTRCDQLLDVVGIDYLTYPEWRGPRFGVAYPLKSTVFRHRLTLKVLVEEDDAAVPSIHDLYRSANWAEREVWDQFGIVFQGHPNLKRLLNHHEFVGHPLRKDYPCQKRQKLSANDPMLDELTAKLRSLGWEILEIPEPAPGLPLTPTPEAASR